jgi:uroporphyrinogen-III synthase
MTGYRGRGFTRCCSAGKVLLTREAGKNDALRDALAAQGVDTVELPMVHTAPGPDKARLSQHLKEQRFDWVAVTSPEAAQVLADGWREAGEPAGIKLAVVGPGAHPARL